MKRLLCAGLMLLATCAMADEEILFSGDIESGGFGGPVVQISQFKGVSALVVGGRGGWIINHSFILGGGGYGLTTNVKADVQSDGRDLYLNVNYGGLLLEYVFESDKLLHFSMHALLGGGGVNYTTHRMGDEYHNWENDSEPIDLDAIFVAEPGIALNLNVTKFFRIGAGVSYRYVSGVALEGLTNDDLNGFGANLYFNFGSF